MIQQSRSATESLTRCRQGGAAAFAPTPQGVGDELGPVFTADERGCPNRG
jgi:hypothetical protein